MPVKPSENERKIEKESDRVKDGEHKQREELEMERRMRTITRDEEKEQQEN